MSIFPGDGWLPMARLSITAASTTGEENKQHNKLKNIIGLSEKNKRK